MTTGAVRAQYEAYPYPERDPADEAKRLIVGSPSHPVEMDHVLWGGARDWSRPLRALVAGGGTGDGLIQLAQVLTSAGRPYEITYLDLSEAARGVAEARARVRGLKGIRFETGSLLDAAGHGRFDYIDCCGVLHHLDAPQAGFDALAAALAPGGGIGLMVYAPLGRSGVYPLQAAFDALLAGRSPADRLDAARAIFERIPAGHPFKSNPHLVDHRASDAGFYDLLLHSTDRAFAVRELLAAIGAAGLALAGFAQPALYDPAPLLPDGVALPDDIAPGDRMALAENLRGTIKTHVAYAVTADAAPARPGRRPDAVPHLRADRAKLARVVDRKGEVALTIGGERVTMALPRRAAPLIAAADGRTPLAAIRAQAGLDPVAFGALWDPVERGLAGWGQLHYSRLLVR